MVDVVGTDVSSDQMNCQTGKLTCHSDATSEQMHTRDTGTEQCELSEKTNQIGSACLDNEQRVLGTVRNGFVIDDISRHVSDNTTRNADIQLSAPPQYYLEKSYQNGEGSCLRQSTVEQVSGYLSNNKSENKCQRPSQNVQNDSVEITNAVTSHLIEDQMQSSLTEVNMSSANEQLDPPSGVVAKDISSDCLERKSKRMTQMWLGHNGNRTSKLLKKKCMLRSLGGSDRALQSRTQEELEVPKLNSTLFNVKNDRDKRRRGRKKKKMRGEGITDEFSRIRAHLRYLLNRVSYEQSLIDAYSGEGWKGYSIEKLKPEKELQRAKAEILWRKLKIRDLFRNLDSLCAEGKLPESLFNVEGEICSEDIFCAKCGSKELTTDNDIILCDGGCDRGFHQFCLDPPLLTEDIPPGDEGWLCPGCDCKLGCIELLNGSLGTSLSVSDTWERFFPEAAANKVDHNLGLPSDDSDDDDYNPNDPEDEEVEGGESSSDESECASVSEKLKDLRSEDRCLGLPSEDSQDDDYDPNAPDLDRRVTEEISSSDFTSDSEDLVAAIEDNTISGQDEEAMSASLYDIKQCEGSNSQKCKTGKKPSVADELSSLLEPDPDQEGSTPVSGKRHIERLDYKKLYDETFQNVQSDTSDDEDWTNSAAPSRKRKFTGKAGPVSPHEKMSTLGQKETTHAPKRNTRQNKVKNVNNSPIKALEGFVNSGFNDKKPGSSTYRRLGEAVVERLHKSFKENQYPDRTTKEGLAQELGVTFQQVTKWFENVQWSFQNSLCMETSTGRNASQQTSDRKAENYGAPGEERDCELVSQKGSGQKE